ncbi:uncharacterized protein [Panulirus ornatus]|uniref:uncharacterized protein n=1 Tax=Panulirus ornatus TaxID=150431 RepID=UPI003A8517CE
MPQSFPRSSAVMASVQFLLLSLVVMAATGAPQFGDDSNEQPTPYDFAYGVNVPDTGDAKEHKESVSPSGRTEGEYRWLQPNGLYLVVRYYVDGDSGFQAEVSEEPGDDVTNYYSNTLSQVSSSGALASQGFGKSIDASLSSTLGAAVNVISAPRPSLNRQPSFTPSQNFNSQQQRFNSQEQRFNSQEQRFNSQQQSFSSQEQGFNIQQQNFNRQQQNFNRQRQSFNSQEQRFNSQEQRFGNEQNFNLRQESRGNIIDGGIIDGGIIDGGIINGEIIDGGIINDSNENDSRFQG